MAFEETNNPLIPVGYDIAGSMITLGAVVIGIGFVVVIALAIYRGTRMANRGQNPLTLQEDLAYKAMQSNTLAPAQPLEQRLAELDDLHRRGVITDDEHRSARAEALRG
ncbi:SHOCT domain-containing protein [Curtobacterium sp. MCPF17_002]|uniref:SHOCT domain-containing protein n=1 Tax=Curtobacterium sp. MCPF17_002 TaxID=2175645 RepID=UPI000DA935E1|nr:SHOCT domain-containing protein [Curtobacterium sp. MCPF17_002]WIB77820.1 SHOCT domain-containing protein [Curtobacterium sp. MCPF17_002]